MTTNKSSLREAIIDIADRVISEGQRNKLNFYDTDTIADRILSEIQTTLLDSLPRKEGLDKRGIPLGQWTGYNQCLTEVRTIIKELK